MVHDRDLKFGMFYVPSHRPTKILAGAGMTSFWPGPGFSHDRTVVGVGILDIIILS